MEEKTTTPKKKLDWKLTLGLVFGILGTVSSFTVLLGIYTRSFQESFIFGLFYMGILFMVVPLLSLIGIILGLLSLKSQKKNLASIGIILSLIGLFGSAYVYWIALRISWG